MSRKITHILIVALLYAAGTCYGQGLAETSYSSLRTYSGSSIDRWNSMRESIAKTIAEKTTPDLATDRRPVLPGVNNHNLELLQDAVARKYHRYTGKDLAVARRALASRPDSSIPKLRGFMAEAKFLDLHPEWEYVSNPNATQHDVRIRNPNGGPGIIRYGQIKFHMNGNSATYVRDMFDDHLSHDFFIPDDHVDGVKKYLKAEADNRMASGDRVLAEKYYKKINRVKGMGVTSSDIDKDTRQAFKRSKMVQSSPYALAGATASLLIAPIAWDLSRGEIDSAEAYYRIGKSGSSLAVGAIAHQGLKQWHKGRLVGSVKGNLITTSAVFLTETSWQVYEYGGIQNAMQSPDFIISFGSNSSALACGIAGMYAGGAVGSAVPVPGATFVGATTGALVAGTAGAIGGEKVTKWGMIRFAPGKYYAHEATYMHELQQEIEAEIGKLQSMQGT